MHWFRIFVLGLAGMFCVAAQAQWQWLDHSGRKVYSDQPPPTDIPLKNILKQPGRTNSANTASAAVAAAPSASAATPALSANDKELQAKRKAAEAEALAKVKEESDSLAKIRATNCEKARANQALFDSGVRMAVTNAKGEREFLDDAARAAEQRRIRTVIDSNCK